MREVVGLMTLAIASTRPAATSTLRMWAYCLVLAAIAFVQEPGRIVGDTKFDLAIDPVGFLSRALVLWDPNASFGQIQNQAYGYLWPMGPFFALGELVGLPEWVVQRLWWTLLLCLAFVGAVKLAQALRIGTGWAQVLAGFAFALSARMITIVGPTSVEAWPSAMAPWVLLPLVWATQGGSVRRGAALSALAVASAGGVNAVAVSAVLPLGVLWILTREAGAPRRALFGWWTLFTVLATLWWLVPLFILGRYSVPFLDYIENAPITTLPTGLVDVLAGTSDWVAYISPEDWFAGNLLATTPILLLNAVLVAALGLAGIVRQDNPHRAFLFLGVMAGAALVGFGYTGPLDGWGSEARQALLDGELAAFRNLHKYDVVLKLSLVLGLAHFVSTFRARPVDTSDRTVRFVTVLVALTSVAAVAAPAYAGRLAPPRSFEEVPDYWRQAAAYLSAREGRGVALEVPATRFGDYSWGSPHDDVLQPLTDKPWAVRNVLPLGQPGYVRVLDAITQAVESGRPSSTLAPFLARNGVSHVVVRNDLDPFSTERPDPVVLHQVLDRSPGLTRAAAFGPKVGGDPVSYTRDGVRVLANRGRQDSYASVEIYEVAGETERVSAWKASSVPVVAGSPASGLRWQSELLEGPTVLAGDRSPAVEASPRVLTDSLRRRETAFTEVRDNVSATKAAGEAWSLRSVVPNHRLADDQEQDETVVVWRGDVSAVRASSSQSEAAATPPVRRDRHPGAVLDGDPRTEWASTGMDGAVGEWWRVRFDEDRWVDEVTVTMGTAAGRRVTGLRIRTAAGEVGIEAPRPGDSGRYALPAGDTSFVEVTADRVAGGGRGIHFALAEVTVPDVSAERALATPDAFFEAPDQILLARDDARDGCVTREPSVSCNDLWTREGEEGDHLRREVTVDDPAAYDTELTASLRSGPRAAGVLAEALPIRARASSALSEDVRASGVAAVDGDPATAWVADADDSRPKLQLSWDRSATLRRIRLDLRETTPGAQPEVVELRGAGEVRRVWLRDGVGEFAALTTDDVVVRFLDAERAYSFEGPDVVQLPVGVAEVSFPDAGLPEVDASRNLDLPCGTGPKIVNGDRAVPTRVRGDLAALMSGEPVDVVACGEDTLSLRAGANDVSVAPSNLTRAEQLRLTRTGASISAPDRLPARVARWGAVERAVQVGARDRSALLVVDENINDGWVATLDGERLTTQRIDGWKQAWVLPPGPAATVSLAFPPDRTYRVSLVLGAAGVGLVLLALWLLRGRRRRVYLPTSTRTAWLVVPAAIGFGGFATGWVGAAAVVVAVAVSTVLDVRRCAPLLSGGLLALAGAAHAAQRLDEFVFSSWPAQLLAVLALATAAAGFGASGPTFFRRRRGRSRR